MKRKGTLTHTVTWMHLKSIKLSEKSQTQKIPSDFLERENSRDGEQISGSQRLRMKAEFDHKEHL